MMLSSELPAGEVCLRLAAALRPYWEWQGYLTEGGVVLAGGLEIPLEEKAGKTLLAARARVLREAAGMVCLQNEPVRAVELAEESIALWRQLDESHGLATALFYRGWAAHVQGEHELAKRLYEEGLQLTDDTWLRAQLLFYLGAAAGLTADFEQMRSFYDQSRKLFEQVGDKSAMADMLKDMGGWLMVEGNYSDAVASLLQSIELSYELGHTHFVSTGLGLLGFACGLRAKPEPVPASLHAAQLCRLISRCQDWLGRAGRGVSACWCWEWWHRVTPRGRTIAETVGRKKVIRVRNAIRYTRHVDLHVEESIASPDRYRIVLLNR